MSKSLLNGFKKAGLFLKVVDKSMRSGNGMDKIFQLDIQRGLSGNTRTEYFRMYLGADNNLIQIRDTDPDNQQLLLMVREHEREWVETRQLTRRERNLIELNGSAKWLADNFGPREIRRIKLVKDRIAVSHKTPKEVRYFLMGVDERQLFIAQLRTPATTVVEARKSLGSTVQFADGKRAHSPDRQGEWFFTEISRPTREFIENLISKNEVVVKHNIDIGRAISDRRSAGNPHTAEQLVILRRNNVTDVLAHSFPIRPDQMFVRGKITHKDHKTKHFSNWREVIRNGEGATASASSSGVFWVD